MWIEYVTLGVLVLLLLAVLRVMALAYNCSQPSQREKLVGLLLNQPADRYRDDASLIVVALEDALNGDDVILTDAELYDSAGRLCARWPGRSAIDEVRNLPEMLAPEEEEEDAL